MDALEAEYVAEMHPMRGKDRMRFAAVRTIHSHPAAWERTVRALILFAENGVALVTFFLAFAFFLPNRSSCGTAVTKWTHISPGPETFDLAVLENFIHHHRYLPSTVVTSLPALLVDRIWSLWRRPLPASRQLRITVIG